MGSNNSKSPNGQNSTAPSNEVIVHTKYGKIGQKSISKVNLQFQLGRVCVGASIGGKAKFDSAGLLHLFALWIQPNHLGVLVRLEANVKNDCRIAGVRSFLQNLWFPRECWRTLGN